jgi:hypothetical protein
MKATLRRKLIAGTVAAVAVAGGGAAIAATRPDSPSERSKAIVTDAAKQLGIDPSKLEDALKKAAEKQVDAAVAAGQLTKEQGDKLKQAIEAGDVPVMGGGRFFGHGFGLGIPRGGMPGIPGLPLLPILPGVFGKGIFGSFDAAATYLGMTDAELRDQLASGKSLADVAKAKGKSVDGLVSAIVASATKSLDQAVAAGKLTKEQEQSIESGLTEVVTKLVNTSLPTGKGLFGPGFRFHGGPFGGFFSGQEPRHA